jgi:branched-chain amino acid aminotransferase
MIYWINGQLVSQDEAKVSALDHGFTVGDGVFETLLVRNGVPFALDLHLARLANSLAGMGLTNYDADAIKSGIAQVVAQITGSDDHRLRITVTSGAGPLGSGRGNHDCTYVVTAAPATIWSATADLLLVPYTRNPKSATAGLKTTSYAENVVALNQASSANCSEALFLDTTAMVSEGTGSNIFWTDGTTLYTPSAQTGLLEGITRALVIHWAREWSIPVEIGKYEVGQLCDAKSAFITSSTRDIQPIANLYGSEGVLLKSFMPSDLVTSLQTDFRHRMASDSNPATSWQIES